MNIIDNRNEKEIREKTRLNKRTNRSPNPRLASGLSNRIRSKLSYEGSSTGAYQGFGYYARF